MEASSVLGVVSEASSTLVERSENWAGNVNASAMPAVGSSSSTGGIAVKPSESKPPSSLQDGLLDIVREGKESDSSSGPPPLKSDGAEDACAR